MFDVGFAELVLIAVVGLLVIGPERLPATVRTASLWVNRIRRGFNEIKQEVQQELHNDAVMQELRKTGEEIKQQAGDLGRELRPPLDSSPAGGGEQRADDDTPDPRKTGE
jgi:sec-independent protein translocase protein TatB